ncbi:hydantoinase/carbamoylase family amidase [Pararhodobacter sp. SW119]|uniref:hydantoinase/carbamoylase family amidase n=1 Tax=Pararhodobacter sp. SW119 TaxID=2780075 RepID=UPI001FD81F4A|nr:hydantoinase/carbamoylase family amidase [Pararhodobacter sp. SW119]
MTRIHVDPARMLSDLDHLRTIGGQGTGVARRAFSDPDIAARKWLADQMQAAGLEVIVDPCGNLFGLPPGDGPCLLVGSHSDTQPLGGWLDGIWGVACGLELARAAQANGGPPFAVVSFQDEEGRFGRLTGSSVWTGQLSLAEADACLDEDALDDPITFATARERAKDIGPLGSVSPDRFTAYIEPHIEQGPVLDSAGEALGVVGAIVGVRQWSFRFEGEANHAGTTPMQLRRDALQGFASYSVALNEVFAPMVSERTVWTLGRIVVEPNANSIVPGAASFTVQIRDAEVSRLDAMAAAAHTLARQVASERGLILQATRGSPVEPVPMDPRLQHALEVAAETVAPGRWRSMPSGALHDASNVARVLPTAMLFAPSIGGISHNPNEDTRREDLCVALEALADAAGRLANTR